MISLAFFFTNSTTSPDASWRPQGLLPHLRISEPQLGAQPTALCPADTVKRTQLRVTAGEDVRLHVSPPGEGLFSFFLFWVPPKFLPSCHQEQFPPPVPLYRDESSSFSFFRFIFLVPGSFRPFGDSEVSFWENPVVSRILSPSPCGIPIW